MHLVEPLPQVPDFVLYVVGRLLLGCAGQSLSGTLLRCPYRGRIQTRRGWPSEVPVEAVEHLGDELALVVQIGEVLLNTELRVLVQEAVQEADASLVRLELREQLGNFLEFVLLLVGLCLLGIRDAQ